METRTTYLRRKQMSGRTKRRMALGAAAFVACFVALFAYVSMHLQPVPKPVLAKAPVGNAPVYFTVDGKLTAKRRIYPFSVVPGGVLNRGELLHMVHSDQVVAQHYAGFSVATAHVETVTAPRAVHVSYRRGDKIYWTAKKVMLKTGESVLSDGKNLIRGRCGNRISDTARFPIETNPPKTEVLDSSEEADEAPAPMGLSPVPGTSNTAQTFPTATGSNNGGGAAHGTPFAQFASSPIGGGTGGTETPPTTTTPVTPPVDTPPVTTPPVTTPPVTVPPVDTPPVDTPPVVTPPTPTCTELGTCPISTPTCADLGTCPVQPPPCAATGTCPTSPPTPTCEELGTCPVKTCEELGTCPTGPCTPGDVKCPTTPCVPGAEACPIHPVPEPRSPWLIAIAGAALLVARRRDKWTPRRHGAGTAPDA